MNTKWIACVSAAVLAIVAFWVCASTGLGGAMAVVPALLCGGAFGWLIWKSSAKAFAIPAVGFAIGLLGTFALQLVAGGSFGARYYLFFSILVMCAVSLFASALLLALPGLRKRWLGPQ